MRNFNRHREESASQIAPAFTLVELLVVIGIIALLISILLPALNSARRSANAVKCATQLRELGNCFRFYANDHRGFQAPALITPKAGVATYNHEGTEYPITIGATNYGIYWFNFIGRYVSKNQAGVANQTVGEGVDLRQRSVIWGCNNWDGYPNTTYGFNRVHPGYGMNGYPSFTNTKNATAAEYAYNATWEPSKPGIGFVKATAFNRQSAERMLLADGRLWLAESLAVPATGVIPPNPGEVNVGNAAGETNISLWRHSKLPTKEASGKYPVTANGKYAFNVLYCDGHVSTVTDPKEAYKSIRMKFPG